MPVKDSITRRRAPVQPLPRRWASLKEAAEYLGVTVATIRQMITDGKLRGYRANQRLYRVDLNELDAAMVPFGGGV